MIRCDCSVEWYHTLILPVFSGLEVIFYIILEMYECFCMYMCVCVMSVVKNYDCVCVCEARCILAIYSVFHLKK